MAKVHITLMKSEALSGTGETLPVESSAVENKQYLANPAASTATGFAVPGTGATGLFWVVTASGGDAFVKFGTGTPVASEGNDHLVLAGQTRTFAAVGGHKAAAINA